SILAYPEGTRSRSSRVLPFKKGAFVVAVEAQVPVVPVAIHGADRVLSSTGFRVRPGTIRVAIGEPIETKGMGRDDRDALTRKVHDEVCRLHRLLGGEGDGRAEEEPARASA